MTNDQIRIAVAEAHGWAGVPVEQQWLYESRRKERYWRSQCPVEIYNALGNDYGFSCMQIARWLKQPNGEPLILRKQAAGAINGFPTYRDRPVLQDFSATPEYSRNYSFQTNPWPKLAASLDYFVEYLPDYCNDLNAMHEAEKTCILELNDPTYYHELEKVIGRSLGLKLKRGNEKIGFSGWLTHASARQRAEAFLKTLNLWKS